jgi:hypothetical protein
MIFNSPLRYIFFAFSVLSTNFLFAQESIKPLTNNPILIEKQSKETPFKSNREGVNEIFIYTTDTLDLPIIDDFSSDRFRKFNATPNTPGIQDTTLYFLFYNGEPIHPDTAKYITLQNYTLIFNEVNEEIQIDSIPMDSLVIQVSNMDLENFELTDEIVWNGYNIIDSTSINGKIDTIYFVNFQYTQDSTLYYIVPPDTGVIWIDDHVYLNNHLPLCPPTRGVATFDGLDRNGYPYNFSNPFAWGIADYLTSKPINLEINPDISFPYQPTDSIYLSFFYQPQGIGNDPEFMDSLVVEFYSPDDNEWTSVWHVGGTPVEDFKQVFIPITDVKYFRKGFRFRFKNYATLSGNLDHWHVDYVRLDAYRAWNDEIIYDVAYTKSPITLIKDYTAMPWKHYQDNPSQMMLDQTVFTEHHNLSDQSEQFTNDFIVRYQGNTLYSQGTTQEPGFPDNSFRCWTLSHYNSIFPGLVFDPTVDDVYAVFDVTFRSSNIAIDINRNNDSITFQQVFKNYYAYDDGSAEGTYEVFDPSIATKIAYEFDIKKEDTLIGVSIHFNPVVDNLSTHPFRLMAWKKLNPEEEIIIQNETFSTINYNTGGHNVFTDYFFDNPVLVNEKIYVGIRQEPAQPANIGWDKNTNNQSKIYFKFDELGGLFNNTAFQGSLLMRPIFASEYGVSSQEKTVSSNIEVYPNPASTYIQFKSNLSEPISISLFDLSGRLVKQSISNPEDYLDISYLPNGMYIVSISGTRSAFNTHKKIMIQR